MKQSSSDELLNIPGIGKSMAADFHTLGVHRIKDLKNTDPEKLYKKLCKKTNTKVDPCVLYVFRCAVYFASHKTHNPELLKWWNWKEKTETY